MSNPGRCESRLLMIAASERDQHHAARMFREDGVDVDFCQTVAELLQQIDSGAAAVLLSDWVIRRDRVRPFVEALQSQPAWSDLPVILVTSDDRLGWSGVNSITNATILRQPVHVETLLSVVRSAISSRRRQYQIRDLLEQQRQIELELRLADQRKDEFLATLAHELRNPISPIKNALDLVDISDKKLVDEVELRGIMHRQVRQLTRIVDDLLDVSRITRGKIRLVRQIFDLRDAIESGVEASFPFIEQSQQELVVKLGSEPLLVNGDVSRLSQCVANLLNNAAKYTPPGGRIELTAESMQQTVIVSVRDSGIGISPDLIDSVFELFQQHDVDRERGQSGLGIGLTLVQRLVQQHAGSIEVHSEGLGRGSTFTIRLPATRRTAAADRDKVAENGQPISKPTRVLVIEDAPAIRFVLQRLLQAMGHHVSLACDGLEGLERAASERPECIISDISMPRMNGLQFAKRIREQREFDQTPLVAMTGYGRAEDRAEAFAAGFDHHLTKPVDIAELRQLFGKLHDGNG